MRMKKPGWEERTYRFNSNWRALHITQVQSKRDCIVYRSKTRFKKNEEWTSAM